jgi:site-specific recombinase XerD
MTEELRLRNSSEETIRSYIGSVERFARYYDKSPDRMDVEQVRSYLLHLLEERKLSWSAIHANRAALRFLYVRFLKQRWFDEEIQNAQAAPKVADRSQCRRDHPDSRCDPESGALDHPGYPLWHRHAL